MTNNVREIVVQQMKMIECKSVVGARGILFQKNVKMCMIIYEYISFKMHPN